MKQKLLIFLVLTVLTSILPCHASVPNLSAQAFILMDADSGRVLLERESERELPIASTTKIMTALVALERGSLSDLVRVKREHLVEGSSMYLKEGEELTLEALLYGLLLASGNDAAECIADSFGGEDFIAAMNEKAAALGMTDSFFVNASGLDAQGHRSSARDMARLAAYAMEQSVFSRIVSTKTAEVGERVLSNHNKLLGTLAGCIGLKTGYTSTAGRTLVSCCEREGVRLVAVTLNDRDDWADHAALYEYGFTAFEKKTAVRCGDVCAYLPVEGTEKKMALTAQESIAYLCGKDEYFSVEKKLPDTLSAPMKAGDAVGELIISCNGQEIGRTALVCAEDMEENNERQGMLQRIFLMLGE